MTLERLDRIIEANRMGYGDNFPNAEREEIFKLARWALVYAKPALEKYSGVPAPCLKNTTTQYSHADQAPTEFPKDSA